MAGLHGSDLFVVNRISATPTTYKSEINDIGEFLVTEPRPPGGNNPGYPNNFWVNSGPLGVRGPNKNYVLGDNIVNRDCHLFDANQWETSRLDFKPGFKISCFSQTDCDFGVNVNLDFHYITSVITQCDTSLYDDGDCIRIDIPDLADRLLCGGNDGLDSSNGCITVDLCDISGLTFGPDGCLQVDLCGDNKPGVDGGQIINPTNCLELNLERVVNDLTCGGGSRT